MRSTRAGGAWSRYVIFAVLAAGLAFVVFNMVVPHVRFGTSAVQHAGKTVQLAGETIQVDVADTDATREKGLGGRESLAQNSGMLFIFASDGVYPFWMKDMHFAIDILWLSDSGAVVYAVQSVSPDTYPAVFTPRRAARYVLELPAGWMEAHHVRVGDVVKL